MKKFSLLLASVLVFAAAANAQNGGYKKGDNLLNIGIGVNSYYNSGIPIGASYERGITQEISAGPNVDYLSNTYHSGSYSYKFTTIYFGVRGSYHVNELLNIKTEKADVYGGATLGFRSFSWKDSDGYSDSGLGGVYGNGLYLGAYIGGKYYFNPKIGAFVELGAIGSTNARLGVAFKF